MIGRAVWAQDVGKVLPIKKEKNSIMFDFVNNHDKIMVIDDGIQN